MQSLQPPPTAPPSVLLARDRISSDVLPQQVVRPDLPRRGATVVIDGQGRLARAEPGPTGPLILTAHGNGRRVVLEVWGPPDTPEEAGGAAMKAAAAWVGLADDVAAADEVITACPTLAPLQKQLGRVRLSRAPRLNEALGRSIIEQLVQSKEARISIAQLTARAGTRVTPILWHWPKAQELGSTPVWELRRCGVSGRGTRALHAAAGEDRRLEATRGDWAQLERRLRALPGVGPWTSAETRIRLGDPDAVSVGDYNLPSTVGYALSGPDGDGQDGAWTDAGMLSLLAPYAGQRGRVIRLVERAAGRGLVPRRLRRTPRAALSAHRYW